MALSKDVKLRIQLNKSHRRFMWKRSRQYGVSYRFLLALRAEITMVRIAKDFNAVVDQTDTFGEMFFPVIKDDVILEA